jgi:ketosteroid isomerase-like protein
LAVTTASPVETVQSLYAAFGRGDIATVLASLAPDARWSNPGPSEFGAYFGEKRGHEEILALFGFLGQNFEFTVFEPREFFAVEEKVVVLLRIEGRVPATGKQFEEDAVQVFTFQDGAIVRFQDFQDSNALAEALRG